jgi:hypothetical protein
LDEFLCETRCVEIFTLLLFKNILFAGELIVTVVIQIDDDVL